MRRDFTDASNIWKSRSNISHAWTVKSRNLSFERDAEAAILEIATELFAEFEDSSVPLITSDVKKQLARQSMSLALLCGRTTVTTDDVGYMGEVRDLCRVLKLGPTTGLVLPKDLVGWVVIERAKDPLLDTLIDQVLSGRAYSQKELADELGNDYRTIKPKLDALHSKLLVKQYKQRWSATPLLALAVKEAQKGCS